MPKIKMPRKSFKIDFCRAWLCVELQKKQSVEPSRFAQGVGLKSSQ